MDLVPHPKPLGSPKLVRRKSSDILASRPTTLRTNKFRGCLLQREFFAFVRERQFCQSPSDCIVVETFCPFGLGVAVNRAYKGEVAAKYEVLAAEFNKFADCKYSGFLGQIAVCVRGRCDKEHPAE